MSNSSSPPETSFKPRPEFRREHKQPNTFSLLALAGSNCIRLYSFPLPVILHLRRFLDQASLVAAYREDVPNNFCEFALQGKPWASPKSVATEGLLLELMGVVYHHGYTYLSTLDYGRETDDRLAIAFSKSSVRSDSPASPDYSKSSFTERPSKGSRVPFALSFPSSTLLRVICPPLDSTPAILQAVRGSWPRGVVSEKKVGDSTFEFKLKGYKWFQQDTFATDSLRHILSLLSSLDSHSFTLLASISLTNSRSRVKDLWLFTSPTRSSADIAYPDSPASSVNTSQADLKRNVHSPELPPYQTSPTHQSHQHRRLATEPVPQTPSPLQHVRATTEDPTSHPSSSLRKATPSPTPSHTLRKPAPRAQLPVSVYEDGVEPQSYRAQLPSTIPSGIENMTGVGAGVPTPDVFYSTSPFHGSPQEPTFNRATEQFPPPPLTPKIQYSDTTHQEDVPLPSPQFQLNPSSSSEPNTPPLLGPGVFRDSAFSTSSEMSAEIPIKWTGVITDPVAEAVESTPDFPGGWQPTPVEEKPDETSALNITLDQDTRPEQPIQAVAERVASPTLSDGEGPRKSESGLIGMVTSSVDKGKGREVDEVQKEAAISGQAGWVLVNVEGSSPAEMTASPVQEKQSQSQDSLKQPAESSSGSGSLAMGTEKPLVDAAPTSPSASMSPAAKAIVIVDAVDAKNKKSQAESASRIRRLFSLSRKDSKKSIDKGAKHKKTRSNVEVRSASIPEVPED